MNKEIIQNLFDDEKYSEVLDLTNPYKNNNINDFNILYYLKSKLAIDGFHIKEKKEIKKLFFYYFYLIWEVSFDNNYSFSFKKELKIDFLNFDNDIKELKNYKNYFNLWKNEVFLNKIIDISIWEDKMNFNHWAKSVIDIVDFFLVFTHDCSELYAFSWEHFPLFKWLINELLD